MKDKKLDVFRVESKYKAYLETVDEGDEPETFAEFITRPDFFQRSLVYASARSKVRHAGFVVVAVLAAGWVLGYAFYKNGAPLSLGTPERFRYDARWGTYVAVAVTFSLIAVVLTAVFASLYLNVKKRRWTDVILIGAGKYGAGIKSGTSTDLAIATLWLNNKSQIENYHRLVLGYADRSRWFTFTCLVLGFLFISVIGISAVFSSTGPGAISGAIVAATTAALTGFITQASLRNSESSSQELRAFFAHPLDVERALAAERLVEQMPTDDKANARLVIINYLASTRDGLDGPHQGAGGQGAQVQ